MTNIIFTGSCVSSFINIYMTHYNRQTELFIKGYSRGVSHYKLRELERVYSLYD